MNIKESKDKFLASIISKNKKSMNKYKRVSLSPIRYAGGKSLAVGNIIEELPDEIYNNTIISPCTGGGSVEIALSKMLNLKVIGFDIFDILCNYWTYQIAQPHELYEQLKELKPEKETFTRIRKALKAVWDKELVLDNLTLSVYYVYNLNLSYGPAFAGWSSDIYFDEKRYKYMIERVRDFQPKDFSVSCASFEAVFQQYPDYFFICDPPYYLNDPKMFAGMYPQRNFPVHHKGFNHDKFYEAIENHKGGAIVCYNKCDYTIKKYKNYKITYPSWQYTMGQGEKRIVKNRIEKETDYTKESNEMIIYKPPII